MIGRQDASEATIETLKAIPHTISTQAQILVEICSYAGTSNVLKIQSLLHHCAEHVSAPKTAATTENGDAAAAAAGNDAATAANAEANAAAAATEGGAANAAEGGGEASSEEPKKKDDTYQAFAVIGIALVAMGEDVGAEMSLRQFNHLVS